ncbi:MAG: ABC transporter permease [Pirellulales bacterium]
MNDTSSTNREASNDPASLAAGERSGAWRLVNTTLGPLLALAIVWLVFAGLDLARAEGGNFSKPRSFQVLARNTASVAVPALGMTIIIIAGGIDLSMGAAMALAATVGAYGFANGCAPTEAMALAVATGIAAGTINGALIGALRIVPFIVTLGTMMIFQGAGRWLAGDTPIRPPRASFAVIADFQSQYPDPAWQVFSTGVWVMLLLSIAVSLVLRYGVFGRYVFALGSNEATARLCGINVPWTRVAVYAIGGMFAGVAGIYQFAALGQGDPMGGVGKELRIIAAVVVGGGSLSGGRGSVLGTLSGAAIMAVIDHGSTMLSIGDMYQDILIGAIIIAAVALDQYRQRRMANSA